MDVDGENRRLFRIGLVINYIKGKVMSGKGREKKEVILLPFHLSKIDLDYGMVEWIVS